MSIAYPPLAAAIAFAVAMPVFDELLSPSILAAAVFVTWLSSSLSNTSNPTATSGEPADE